MNGNQINSEEIYGSGRVVCPNCGADFDESLPKCPYCGQLAPKGAEREHMEKLGAIRKQTEELAGIPKEAYRKDLGRYGKRLLIALLITAAAIVLILILVRVHSRSEAAKQSAEIQAQRAFEKEQIPQLEELHEAGKYDEALELYWALYDKPGHDAIYRWKHNAFYEVYWRYRTVADAAEELNKAEPDTEFLAYGVCDAMALTRSEGYGSYGGTFSAEDKELCEGYRLFAEDYLEKVLQTDSAGLDAFYESCLNSYGSFDYQSAEKAAKKRLENG